MSGNSSESRHRPPIMKQQQTDPFVDPALEALIESGKPTSARTRSLQERMTSPKIATEEDEKPLFDPKFQALLDKEEELAKNQDPISDKIELPAAAETLAYEITEPAEATPDPFTISGEMSEIAEELVTDPAETAADEPATSNIEEPKETSEPETEQTTEDAEQRNEEAATSEEQPRPRFTVSSHQLIYSSPEEHTIKPKLSRKQYEYLLSVHNNCKSRFDSIARLARGIFPATDTPEAVVKFIERSKVTLESASIDKKIKLLEAQNLAMLTAPVEKPKQATPKQREVKRLLKDIQEAEKRIKILSESPIPRSHDGSKTIFNFEDEIMQMKVEWQVQVTKEKALIAALAEEVESAEEDVKVIEKRIALMTQKKSEYVAWFTEKEEEKKAENCEEEKNDGLAPSEN